MKKKANVKCLLSSSEIRDIILKMKVGTTMTVHNEGVKTFITRVEKDKYGIAPYDVQVGKFVTTEKLAENLIGPLSMNE